MARSSPSGRARHGVSCGTTHGCTSRVRSLGSGEAGPSRGVAVSVTIPIAAGRRWVARPSSDWIVCRPASGPTVDTPQRVVVHCLPASLKMKYYRAAIVFRTDEGLNRAMTADVEIFPREHFLKTIEAEDGQRAGDMVTGADKGASGGRFIHVPDEAHAGSVALAFDAPVAGRYWIMARCTAPPPVATHDSMFFSLDGAEESRWNIRLSAKAWGWHFITPRAEKNMRHRKDTRAFHLAKGRHTLFLRNRERGVKLDCFAIANAPFPPR